MASQGGFVCSLGWSQTYDRMGSEAICAVLTSFCRLMERAWIHRQWISCYEDVSQDPHSSKMSLCSGSHGGHDCFWLDLGWAWGALSPAESICMIVLSTPLRGRTRRLALGVTLLTGPRKYAAAEAPRIQKALKRAAVLQSSQLFWHLLAMARAYQYFVISACSCGWAVYLPSLTTNKQLLRMFGPVGGSSTYGFSSLTSNPPWWPSVLALAQCLQSGSASRMLQQGGIAWHQPCCNKCGSAPTLFGVGRLDHRWTLQTIVLRLSKDWIFAKLLTLEKIFMHCVHSCGAIESMTGSLMPVTNLMNLWRGWNPLACNISLLGSI